MRRENANYQTPIKSQSKKLNSRKASKPLYVDLMLVVKFVTYEIPSNRKLKKNSKIRPKSLRFCRFPFKKWFLGGGLRFFIPWNRSHPSNRKHQNFRFPSYRKLAKNNVSYQTEFPVISLVTSQEMFADFSDFCGSKF